MYSNIASNKRKTVFIMIGFVLFTALIVYILDMFLGGSMTVFYGGLIGALIYVLITYYSGSKMALSLNRAKEIQKSDNPKLWRTVENLSISNGMPMPKVLAAKSPMVSTQ